MIAGIVWNLRDLWQLLWPYAFGAGWLFCAYLFNGTTRKWHAIECSSLKWSLEDTIVIGLLSLGGPISLLISLLVGDFKYGVHWNWITKPVLTPASSQNGQLDVATLRKAVAALKNTAPMAQTFAVGIGRIPPTVPCIKCGQLTTNVPAGAALCFTHYYPTALVGSKSESTKSNLPTIQNTDPIVGYRVWHLDREQGLLKSCVKDCTWPKRKRLERDVMHNLGIHAVNNPNRLYENGVSYNGLWQEYAAEVAGEIWMWGEVKECVLGYLAEFAYPKQLWVPEDTDPMIVMQLEENYGVPVTMRKEFVKHQPVQEPNPFSGLRQQFFYVGASISLPTFPTAAPGMTALPSYQCARCMTCGTTWSDLTQKCPTCYPVAYNPSPAGVATIQRTGILPSPYGCTSCGAPYPNAFNGLCSKCSAASSPVTSLSLQQLYQNVAGTSGMQGAGQQAAQPTISPGWKCGMTNCPICDPATTPAPNPGAIVPWTPPTP